jgi:hypothetical protein
LKPEIHKETNEPSIVRPRMEEGRAPPFSASRSVALVALITESIIGQPNLQLFSSLLTGKNAGWNEEMFVKCAIGGAGDLKNLKVCVTLCTASLCHVQLT